MAFFTFSRTDRISDFRQRYPEADAILGSLATGADDTLEQVCRRAGRDSHAVLLALAGSLGHRRFAGTAEDLSSYAIGELVDHLLAWHHPYLRAETGRLAVLLDALVPASEPARQALTGLLTSLTPHMIEEEEILFPAFLAVERGEDLAGADPDWRIHGNVTTHLQIIGLLEHLVDLADDLPATGDGYRARQLICEIQSDTDLHGEIEDNILIPAVVFARDLNTARKQRASSAKLRAIPE